MAHADTAALPRVPKLGFQIKVEKRGPPPPDPEDRRPWWRRVLDGIRSLVKIDLR
jgi:hypothetical protein